MTKVRGHRLARVSPSTARRGNQTAYVGSALVDSTCHGTTSSVRQAAKPPHRMLNVKTIADATAHAEVPSRSPPKSTSSLHHAGDSLNTADAASPEPAAILNPGEKAQVTVKDRTNVPDEHVNLTDVAWRQQEAVSVLCSNLLAGSAQRPNGCGISWGRRRRKHRRKDQAASKSVQHALKRQAVAPATRSSDEAPAVPNSGGKHPQPCAACHTSQDDRAAAEGLQAIDAAAVQKRPEQLSTALPAAHCNPGQVVAPEQPAEMHHQRQPSQLVIRLGQMLLELRQQREARMRNSNGAQLQRSILQPSTQQDELSAAAARPSSSGRKRSPPHGQVREHCVSKAAKVSQLLGPGLQAPVAADTAAATLASTTSQAAPAAVMPGNAVNSNIVSSVAAQKGDLPATGVAGSRSSSPLVATSPAAAVDSNVQRLPIHQLPMAMRVSYLREAGFLPQEPSKPESSSVAPQHKQQPGGSVPNGSKARKIKGRRGRPRKVVSSDIPAVRQEKRVRRRCEKQRVVQEHEMVMSMVQIAMAEDADAAARVSKATEVFQARSCVRCQTDRPINGSWFCSKELCREQHEQQYEGQLATAAIIKAYDKLHWQEVKKNALAEQKQGESRQEGASTGVAEAAENATHPVTATSGSAAANGTEQQTVGSASTAADAFNADDAAVSRPCAAAAACSQSLHDDVDDAAGAAPFTTRSPTGGGSQQPGPAAAGGGPQACLETAKVTRPAAADPVVPGTAPRAIVSVTAESMAGQTAAVDAAGKLPRSANFVDSAASGAAAAAAAAAAVVYTPPEIPIKDFNLPEKKYRIGDLKQEWQEHQLHLKVLLMEVQDKPKTLARLQDVILRVFNRVCLRCMSDASRRPFTGCWFCQTCEQSWGRSKKHENADVWKALITGTSLDPRKRARQRDTNMAQLLQHGQVVQQKMKQPSTLLFYTPIAVSGPILAAAGIHPAALTSAAAVSGGSRVPAVQAVLAAAPAGPSD